MNKINKISISRFKIIAILLAILYLNSNIAYSQNVCISATGTTPDASAMLDVVSTSKGLLVPRMSQAQRNAIGSPATSLLIFQTDGTPGYYYNSGTPGTPVWTQVGSQNYWQRSGTTLLPATAGDNIKQTQNSAATQAGFVPGLIIENSNGAANSEVGLRMVSTSGYGINLKSIQNSKVLALVGSDGQMYHSFDPIYFYPGRSGGIPSNQAANTVRLGNGYEGGFSPSYLYITDGSNTSRVGINTNNPGVALEVVGSIKIPAANGTDNSSPGLIYAVGDDFLYNSSYLNHYGFGFHDPTAGCCVGTYVSGYSGIDLFTGGTQRMTLLEGGNIGIGTGSPSSLFSVGASSQFQVNSSGNLTKINNVTYSWPGAQGAANRYLKNDGSGNLTWGDIAASTYGTNNQGVTGTTDITVNSDASWYDMDQMTITFTPIHSVVYLYFNADGDMDNWGMYLVRFRFLKDGATVVGATAASCEDYDSATGMVTAWNASFMKPVSVTPGVSVNFKVQWNRSSVSGSARVRNIPATSSLYTRTMTIID